MIPEEQKAREAEGERMGVLVGGPEDGYRFPVSKVLCECCDGPATHYACKHEAQSRYSVYVLQDVSLILFSDVQYHFDHYETDESDEWIAIDHEESEED